MAMYSILLLVIFSTLKVTSAYTSPLENIVVVRYIDISTQLVIVNTHIKARNTDEFPVGSYIYNVDPQWVENLSYIEVFDAKKNHLVVERNPKFDNSEKTVVQYTILLPVPLSSGEITDFVVTLIITNYLKSYPKSLMQNEKHKVLFTFNVYYHTMYFTHDQTTYLHMGTTKAALIDGAKYTMANDSEYGLQYGPFYRADPFKNEQSVFHYENNSPFLVIEKVTRYVKLSHWGYISVWDQIQILHSGPKLKGPFKRNFYRDKTSAPQDTRIERFVSTLPRSAFDISLKDEIGLIWSFNVNYDDPFRVDVSVEPRYILYGGWKTEYEIGYSLPMSEYVTYHGSSAYVLNFPLLDKIFPNMVVKDAVINIILPEGATFTTIDPNFKLANETDAKYCYYFDTTCRQMITFMRNNLVERHIDLINLSIAYDFPHLNLLVKPFTIAIALYFIFIFLKICSRLFFLTPTEEQVKVVKNNTFQVIPVLPAIKKKNKRNSKQK